MPQTDSAPPTQPPACAMSAEKPTVTEPKPDLKAVLDKAAEVFEILREISKTRPVTPMDAAEALGDPAQTAAMKEFTEGKLSYAEMRGLCG